MLVKFNIFTVYSDVDILDLLQNSNNTTILQVKPIWVPNFIFIYLQFPYSKQKYRNFKG